MVRILKDTSICHFTNFNHCDKPVLSIARGLIPLLRKNFLLFILNILAFHSSQSISFLYTFLTSNVSISLPAKNVNKQNFQKPTYAQLQSKNFLLTVHEATASHSQVSCNVKGNTYKWIQNRGMQPYATNA